jgi:hypothetical protein
MRASRNEASSKPSYASSKEGVVGERIRTTKLIVEIETNKGEYRQEFVPHEESNEELIARALEWLNSMCETMD